MPSPALIAGVPLIFKLHMFLGFTIFLIFPFTRLVHVWSAPVGYLFRNYQVVRTKVRAGAADARTTTCRPMSSRPVLRPEPVARPRRRKAA